MEYSVIYPSWEIQETCLMEAVYGKEGIKSDTVSVKNINKISKATEEVMHQHPALIIAGCTEIELAMQQMTAPIPVVSPMELLAVEIIRLANT
jgi:aspartate racemase